MDTGLEVSEYAGDDRDDLGAVEHHRQFGFSHYTIQAVGGLAEA